MRSSWIEIDLDALRKNTAFIMKRMAPGAKLLAPLKGNAYGHGAVQCARVFAEMGASYFGVAIPEEGVELREAGFKQPILIFGYTFDDSYDLLFDYDLIPNVFTIQQAKALNDMAARRKKRLTIHVSVDTGLHRLGLDLNDRTAACIAEIAAMPNLYVEGIFSMFSTGDQYPDTAYCWMQFHRFMDLCGELSAAGIHIPYRHICDSGATLLFPEMHLEMVRPGSALYGSYCGDVTFPDIEAYPAMSVHSRLACVREIDRGEFVGYNCTWAAQKPSTVGVVPCGYVDGISRIASNHGAVLLHGVRCPIIGNICMDQLMIDITNVTAPQVGDEVVLLGSQGGETITLDEVGAFANTSDTEFICRQGVRLPRYYIENGTRIL
ncbi:alanine racemase [uncultured Dysosmobacter sp.]|uniref:alanine racemase n=1 Tax=uncultured Dysosmobacter sp. TaxID=2591384 RepID=UPI0026118144|nr:alanine racemase [uncultured Dysosmobacter sp.]